MAVPLRVLHVAQPTDAGVASYVTAAAAHQIDRGWDVVVACPDGGRLADDLAGRAVPRRAWAATRSPGRSTAVEVRDLARLVGEVGPDVVHLHSSKAGLAGRLALRRRVPTMFQPHGWSWLATSGVLTEAAKAWERWGARWTDRFVCVGDGERKQARDLGLRGEFSVVRNGVDTTRFRPTEGSARDSARVAVGVPTRRRLVVCAGRVTRQKGQDVLIAAWRTVAARMPDAQLIVIGDGDLLSGLRHVAPAGVTFTPPVPDVRPWLAAADLVVLPSRWEGLSLTLLEAMASGRSVVVSDITGLAEAVPDNAGARVPPGDVKALATAIVQRLNEPLRTMTEGAAAARHARRRFDAQHTFHRLAEVTLEAATRRERGVLRGRGSTTYAGSRPFDGRPADHREGQVRAE